MNWNQPVLNPENGIVQRIVRPITPTYIVACAVLTMWLGTTYVLSNSVPVYEAPLHYGAYLILMGSFVYIPSTIYYWTAGLFESPDQSITSNELEDASDRSWLYPRLWYTIAFRSIGILFLSIGIILYLAVPENPNQMGEMVSGLSAATFLIGGAIFALSLPAPLAVYRDRKFLSSDGDWYPSRWHYLMVFPTGLIGWILSFVYTRRRIRYHGYESSQTLTHERSDLAEESRNE